MERYSAAATVGRRYLWINALGYDSKEWKYSPGNHRRLGNGWLQEAYSHSSHPYPRHRSGRGGYAQTNSAKLQKVWAEGIPGSGRGRGGGRFFGKNKKKQQPQNQQTATGQPSGTESPAAK